MCIYTKLKKSIDICDCVVYNIEAVRFDTLLKIKDIEFDFI